MLPISSERVQKAPLFKNRLKMSQSVSIVSKSRNVWADFEIDYRNPIFTPVPKYKLYLKLFQKHENKEMNTLFEFSQSLTH